MRPENAAAVDDASAPAPAPVLDAEKLVAYRLALELQVLIGTLIPPQHRVLADQLERASLSVVLNIAEAMVPNYPLAGTGS